MHVHLVSALCTHLFANGVMRLVHVHILFVKFQVSSISVRNECSSVINFIAKLAVCTGADSAHRHTACSMHRAPYSSERIIIIMYPAPSIQVPFCQYEGKWHQAHAAQPARWAQSVTIYSGKWSFVPSWPHGPIHYATVNFHAGKRHSHL